MLISKFKYKSKYYRYKSLQPKFKSAKKEHRIKFSKSLFRLSILLLLFLLYQLFPLQKNKVPIKISDNILSDIISYEHNLNLSNEIFNEFRNINRQNKFIEENPKFEKGKNPIISVIVTMHNQAHCLHKCIKSIQNQSIKNIEILIVDDCSTDNTTDIIQQFQQTDPRIILYAHDINEGTIKSRSDGIRKAKGEYILVIDGDDALIHKDILKNSLYISQLGNIDVV